MKSILTATAAALLVTFGILGCDSADVTSGTDGLETSFALAEETGLTESTSATISALFSETTAPDPARTWALAAQLQQTLSREQIDRLVAIGKDPQRFRGASDGANRGHRGFRHDGRHNGRHGLLDSLLTDDQRALVDAARDEFRSAVDALHDQFRDGSITQEEFHTAMTELRDAFRASLDDILTDEQKAALEQARDERRAQREERRGAAFQAMADALGLTPEQVSAMQELRERTHAAMEALRDQLRGATDREAIRARMAEAREAAHGELESILDAAQLELFYIHRAIMAVGPRAMRGADNRRGGARRGPWSGRGN